MKIVYCGYRQWAFQIYQNLVEHFGNQHEIVLLNHRASVRPELLSTLQPEMVLFYGWSWFIPSEIIENYFCVCLHPSPLPKYRGGSPIQNQLIAGETTSAVTLFKMTDELDAGDILKQQPISFGGYLDEILQHIVKTGTNLTIELFSDFQNDTIKYEPQNETEATLCKRRRPHDSEIRHTDFELHEARHFYNLVRGLQPPYPKAFIQCKNGTKLYIEKVNYE